MNDSANQPAEDLAAVYREDPEDDAIDVAAGWRSLRPRLVRRRRRLVIGVVAGIALAASVVLVLLTRSSAPPAVGTQKTQAVAELEAALREGDKDLQPETRAAIERAIAAIDRAMRDAAAALARDPGNDYAANWLETLRRRKLRALRQVL